ncbi:MAG TPA: flagellar hook-associated protein FlgL [Acidisarcina sp.]
MRVTTILPDVLDSLQSSEQALQSAVLQISTGRRVNQISDDPAASASMIQSLASSANVDQFTRNVTSVEAEAQTADSALSSVVSELTQAVTFGTQGSNGALTPANRQAISAQVQGVLSEVVSQANLTYNNAYVFSGTATTTVPFTAGGTSASGYQYNGNSGVNTVQIGDALSTPSNVPGDQIFSKAGADVLGSLSQLVTALQGGTPAQIATATQSVSTAIDHVSQQRVLYGSIKGQLGSQESYLSQETLTLSTQQSALVGVDLSVAATNLSQAELSHNAVLAATAKVLPNTLLDYLK